MSANKDIETKIHDDENPESGYIEQESSEWEESEVSSDDRKVSSELDKLTNPDSGLSLDEARKALSDLDKLINPDSGVGLSGELDDDTTNTDSGLDLDEKLKALRVESDTKPQLHVTPAQERTDKDIPPIYLFFQQDEEGDTQLHIAAVHGCRKSLGTLIRLCPLRYLLDLPNDYGHTALHLAVMSGHDVIAKMLVLAGASIGVRDLNGNTPIHAATAAQSMSCLQALLEPVDSQRKSSKELASLLNIINYNGQTCVHIAANSGDIDTLKTLVSYGADVNAMEGYAGWTALHIAAHRGDLHLIKFLAKKCPGVSARARDYACRTPRRLAKRVHKLSTEKKQKIFDMLPEESDSDTDDDDEDEVPPKRVRTSAAERSGAERRPARRSSAESGTTT